MTDPLSLATEGFLCPSLPLGLATQGMLCVGGLGSEEAVDSFAQVRGCANPQGSPSELTAVMLAMDASVGAETGKGARVKVCTSKEGSTSTQTRGASLSATETSKGAKSKVTSKASKTTRATTKIRG